MKKITALCLVVSMFFVVTAFSSAMAADGSITVPYLNYNPTITEPSQVDITTNESTITNTDDVAIEIWIKAYDADGNLLGQLPAVGQPGVNINAHGAMPLDFGGLCNAIGVEACSFVIDWSSTGTESPIVALAVVGVDAREIPVAAGIQLLK
jgi:hypothetical protein